jgi:hypothetical protein
MGFEERLEKPQAHKGQKKNVSYGGKLPKKNNNKWTYVTLTSSIDLPIIAFKGLHCLQ